MSSDKIIPAHQNRIKTNGSLPKNFNTKERDYNSFEFSDLSQSTDNIENYKKPQSPRTKIRTFISSPSNTNVSSKNSLSSPLSKYNDKISGVDRDINTQYEKDYEDLIKSFEDKFRNDIFNIQNCEIDLLKHTRNALTSSNLNKRKDEILTKIRELKILISESERQENEAFLGLDVEKNLVMAEMSNETSNLSLLNQKLASIKEKICQLETDRTERQKKQELQQMDLKKSIKKSEMEIYKIKEQSEISVESEYRIEELQKSLEANRKVYEDLEFHYLEEETEWYVNISFPCFSS